MTNELPQLLPHCEHKHFCPTCRSRDGGRLFRKGALIRHKIDCDVDFECPKGQLWIKEKSRGLGDTIANLTSKAGIKPCGGCKKRQNKLNKMVPYKKG